LEATSPTQFIRRAALNSGVILTPTPWRPERMNKAARKSDPVVIQCGDLTGVTLPDVNVQAVADAHCWLCGAPTDGVGLPVKLAIRDTFTDIDKARRPTSGSVCQGCAFCLSYMALRNYALLATSDVLRFPSRAQVRETLLDPPVPPFVLCIPVSGQKWLHFRATIACARDFYPVQFEEIPVVVDVFSLARMISCIERLYTAFPKEEIRTGRYKQEHVRRFGMSEFQSLEEAIAPHRNSRLFELAVFVAQKKEGE